MRAMLLAIACVTVAAQDVTIDRAAAIGAQVAGEIQTSITPVGSRLVQDYVDRLGAKIAAEMNPERRFSFLAVSDDLNTAIHEPLAVPGGYVFIPAALILAAKDESEFAGMLAQAMWRAQHPLPARNVGTIPLVLADDRVLPFALLPARRERELAADRAAVDAMARAGFDPSALVRYVDRVQPPDHPRSLLPDRATRLASLEQAIGNLPPAAYQQSDDFLRVQDETRPAPPKAPTLLRRK